LDDVSLEVDIIPDQPSELADPHAGIGKFRQRRTLAVWAALKKLIDFAWPSAQLRTRFRFFEFQTGKRIFLDQTSRQREVDQPADDPRFIVDGLGSSSGLNATTSVLVNQSAIDL
jgi:hypothetical protein